MTKYSEVIGGLAHLVEHLLCKQGVNGSSPLASTIPLEWWKEIKQKIEINHCLKRDSLLGTIIYFWFLKSARRIFDL